MPKVPSPLDGVSRVVNEILGVSYRHKGPLMQKTHSDAEGHEVAMGVFREIRSQFASVRPGEGKGPSPENWRKKPHGDLRNTPKNSEVGLERRLVAARERSDWWNQVPVAWKLGLGRRCSIDLIHERDNGYDFVELKFRSDNPIYAAVEILQYGFVWLLSRTPEHRARLGYPTAGMPLLAAKEVRLCVLAPHAFYRGFDLHAFECGMSAAVAEIAHQHEVVMSFRFFSFEWPSETADRQVLRDLLDHLFA